MASGYVVRLSRTNELVGFFVADSVKELFWLVDECVDPTCCEHKEIQRGGIMWETKGYGLIGNIDRDLNDDLSGADFCERTKLDVQCKRGWKKFG